MKNKQLVLGSVICLIGAVFYCYEYLLRIEPSVMVSDLMEQFKVTASGFGLISALFYYAYTPMQLAVGVLVDRYGARLMLSIAVIACVLGSFLFSIAYSMPVAAIARFIIGFGSSFAFVGVLKLASEWLPAQYFAMFSGITTALGMIGGMFGDTAVISIVDSIGWRSTQYLGTLLGIALIPIVFFMVQDKPSGAKSHENSTLKGTILNLKQMANNPQMWIIGIIGSLLYLSLSAFAELWGIKFLETVYALNNKMAGIACSMVFTGWLLGGPINGLISDKIRSRKLPILVGSLASAFLISFIIFKPYRIDFDILCLILFLFGFTSSAEVICFAVSKESNKHSLTATSIALTNFLVMVGGIIFQPLLGVMLDLFWSKQTINGIPYYSAADYQKAFIIIPVAFAISALLTLFMRDPLRKQ